MDEQINTLAIKTNKAQCRKTIAKMARLYHQTNGKRVIPDNIGQDSGWKHEGTCVWRNVLKKEEKEKTRA